VILGNQQQQAFDKIMLWHKSKNKRFVLAGYAGVGKTTLARKIADAIDGGEVIFCAYTGKAANVLREKGCKNSSTVHGAIYRLVDEDAGKPYFELDQDSKVKNAALVIVDEYSMLPSEIIDDIESLAKKVLYLGDPFQLPPVQGECSLQPDFFMEEIHRQALESPIIRFATDVRLGKTLKHCDLPGFLYQPRRLVPSALYFEADQVICGINKTRMAWNQRFRDRLGRVGKLPVKGDKLICTKNNRELGLFNGMIGEAGEESLPCGDQKIFIHFDGMRDIETWDGPFMGREKPEMHHNVLNRFDYGYVITAHKSQGSEFDHVLIYNQPIGRDEVERRRWKYTAISRGKNRVTLVDP
jgi:exodeoxyribonuclease-5